MTHHTQENIAYSAVAAFMTALCLAVPPAVTRAAVFFVPFGGVISSSVTPNLTPVGIPNPACPVYSVVTNVDTSNGLPPTFGIFIPPELPAPTYDYNNLFVPGAPILGGLDPIPCVGGTAPIPVYPLFYNAPFYLSGEGA